MGLFRRWSIYLLLFSGIAVFGVGLFIDIMDVDAAQYAAMSREMAETGNYLEIYHAGTDYLDKPPLIFWASSIWIKLFGATNWAYKLSSVLFSLLGIISTYKLGHLLYNKRIGFVAGLMLATTQAYFLFNHDVRTDTLLTAAVVFSVWQIMAFIFYRERMHLIGGFFGIGLGMLAKGPIALMIPMLAFASYFIGRNRIRDFFKWDWLLGLAIVALVLSPMVYGLYHQFDLHPEKEITFLSDAGNQTKTNVSGVKFYFWTQSFGRITGENVWEDGSPPTFFIETFFWSFMPWSLLAVWAIFWRIGNTLVDLVKRRKKQEWLTLGGFILPFIAFSTSHYKLPHYIFVLFPFAAIITAEFILRVLFEKPNWWTNIMRVLQGITILAIIAVPLLVFIYVFPDQNIIAWLGYGALSITAIVSFLSREKINQIVLSSALAIIAANWALNTHFYPHLLEFQPSKKAAHWFNTKQVPKENIYLYPSFGAFSFEYYLDHTIYTANADSIEAKLVKGEDVWIYVNDKYLDYVMQRYPESIIEVSFPAYHITMLSFEFLNKQTRPEHLSKQYVLKIPAQ